MKCSHICLLRQLECLFIGTIGPVSFTPGCAVTQHPGSRCCVGPIPNARTAHTLKDALQAYKHQPSLEKRHQQLKSVLGVRPVLLKSHLRIEAFLFLYFLALMTEALIERDFRDRMRKLDINKLPLYPEERPCTAPTAERLFELFADLRRHRLVDDTGYVHQRFYDKLNDSQLTVLRLFNISPQLYLSAAEESADA